MPTSNKKPDLKVSLRCIGEKLKNIQLIHFTLSRSTQYWLILFQPALSHFKMHWMSHSSFLAFYSIDRGWKSHKSSIPDIAKVPNGCWFLNVFSVYHHYNLAVPSLRHEHQAQRLYGIIIINLSGRSQNAILSCNCMYNTISFLGARVSLFSECKFTRSHSWEKVLQFIFKIFFSTNQQFSFISLDGILY